MKLIIFLFCLGIVRIAQADDPGAGNFQSNRLLASAYERVYYWYAYLLDAEVNQGKPSSIAVGCAERVGRRDTPCNYHEFMSFIESEHTRQNLGNANPVEVHTRAEEFQNVDQTAANLRQIFRNAGYRRWLPSVVQDNVIEGLRWRDSEGLIKAVSTVNEGIKDFTRRVKAIRIALLRIGLLLASNVDNHLVELFQENCMGDLLIGAVSHIEFNSFTFLDHQAVLNNAASQSAQLRDQVQYVLEHAPQFMFKRDAPRLAAAIEADRNVLACAHG